MKIVVDTNCLVASIPRGNPEYWLYESFRDERFQWCVSNEILSEYEEVLTRFYNARTSELVLRILLAAPNIILSEPFFKYGLIVADPDDNKFVDLAISINANYLVSNDKHFQILKKLEFPTVHVVRLDEFKKILY
ncbi:MAG: putative toxin-antitoxin system toxin component, PIN family [Chitinophagales bacterium]|jgi:uncharacterized protein|nr:putative toxin-antitoxin system toxin component, PIN family [Chitinophagales bacterium]